MKVEKLRNEMKWIFKATSRSRTEIEKDVCLVLNKFHICLINYMLSK